MLQPMNCVPIGNTWKAGELIMQTLWMMKWNTSSILSIFGRTMLYTINCMKNWWLLFWDTVWTPKRIPWKLAGLCVASGWILGFSFVVKVSSILLAAQYLDFANWSRRKGNMISCNRAAWSEELSIGFPTLYALLEPVPWKKKGSIYIYWCGDLIHLQKFDDKIQFARN